MSAPTSSALPPLNSAALTSNFICHPSVGLQLSLILTYLILPVLFYLSFAFFIKLKLAATIPKDFDDAMKQSMLESNKKLLKRTTWVRLGWFAVTVWVPFHLMWLASLLCLRMACGDVGELAERITAAAAVHG